MCGRITQKSNLKALGLGLTLVEPLTDSPPRYNGAPGKSTGSFARTLKPANARWIACGGASFRIG
jgi:hypothetical protein